MASTSTMPGTDRAEDTRRHILETAALSFGDRGYAGTSLNDLIRASGLSKGAFYFHFPSKESLALEAIHYKQEQWASHIAARASEHPRALDQFTSIPRTLCEIYERDPGSRAIGRLCGELAHEPDLVDKVRPQLAMWVDLVSGIARRAQAEGDLRPDLDPVEVAQVAILSFIGMDHAIDCMVEGARLTPMVERFVEMFLAGVAVEGALTQTTQRRTGPSVGSRRPAGRRRTPKEVRS